MDKETDADQSSEYQKAFMDLIQSTRNKVITKNKSQKHNTSKGTRITDARSHNTGNTPTPHQRSATTAAATSTTAAAAASAATNKGSDDATSVAPQQVISTLNVTTFLTKHSPPQQPPRPGNISVLRPTVGPAPDRIFLCMRRSDKGVAPISCLVDLIHLWMRWTKQRSIHVEMLFCFTEETSKEHKMKRFQVFTGYQRGGINIYDVENTHFHSGRWRFYELRDSTDAFRALYRSARNQRNIQFSMTAMSHVICPTLMQILSSIWCLRPMLRDSSGSYCAQAVMDVFKDTYTDDFSCVVSNRLTPDALYLVLKGVLDTKLGTPSLLPIEIQPPMLKLTT